MAITNKQPVGNRIFTFDALPTDVPVEGLQPGDFVLDSSTNYLYLVSSGHALVQVAAQGGSQAVLTATVNLDNDDIIALPTTPFEIIPAPGLNKAIVLLSAVSAPSFVVAYSNIDAAAQVYLASPDNALTNSLTLSGAAFLQATSGGFAFQFTGGMQGIVDDGSSQTIFTPVGGIGVASSWKNAAVSLQFYNLISGNLHDGDPANTLTIVAFYAVIDI